MDNLSRVVFNRHEQVSRCIGLQSKRVQNSSMPSWPDHQPPGNQKRGYLFILDLAARLRCQHAAKSVNHIAIVAVDYVAIGGLHFQTIARRPGAAAQYTPIPAGCIVASLLGVKAPFPDVSAEIVHT